MAAVAAGPAPPLHPTGMPSGCYPSSGKHLDPFASPPPSPWATAGPWQPALRPPVQPVNGGENAQAGVGDPAAGACASRAGGSLVTDLGRLSGLSARPSSKLDLLSAAADFLRDEQTANAKISGGGSGSCGGPADANPPPAEAPSAELNEPRRPSLLFRPSAPSSLFTATAAESMQDALREVQAVENQPPEPPDADMELTQQLPPPDAHTDDLAMLLLGAGMPPTLSLRNVNLRPPAHASAPLSPKAALHATYKPLWCASPIATRVIPEPHTPSDALPAGYWADENEAPAIQGPHFAWADRTTSGCGSTPRRLLAGLRRGEPHREALIFGGREEHESQLRRPLLIDPSDDLLAACEAIVSDATGGAGSGAAWATAASALDDAEAGHGPGIVALPPPPSVVPGSPRAAMRPRAASFLKVLLLTLSLLGIEFVWAVQVTFTVPTFLQLGLTPFFSSLVWIAGPISGLVVQPLVGAYSDMSEHPFGRRRPFLIVGAVATIAGMMAFCNAADLGKALAAAGLAPARAQDAAILVAALGTAVLVAAVNCIQGPCRALANDLTPPEQSVAVSAAFSFMCGVGQLAGYWTAHLDLKRLLPDLADGSQVRGLFVVGALMLAITTTVTSVAAREQRWTSQRTAHKEQPGLRLAVARMVSALRSLGAPMKRLAVVLFFSWLSMFVFLIYNSSWMADSVFGGVPNGEGEAGARYELGVRAAAFAMCLFAVASMLASPLLPYLISACGAMPVYSGSHLYFGALLAASKLVTGPNGAYAIIAASGVHFAVIITVPYALLSTQAASAVGGGQDGALSLGVLNVFVVLPQFVVTLLGGLLLHAVSYDFSSVMVVAAGFSVVAAVCICKLI